MSLPSSVTAILADGDPLDPELVVEIQAGIVALYNMLITPVKVPLHSSDIAGIVNCLYVNALEGYWNVSGAPGEVRIPIAAPSGHEIREWTVDLRDTASTITARAYKDTIAGTPTALGSLQTSTGTTADQTLSDVFGTPEEVADGYRYWIQVALPANNMRVYGATFTYALTV